MFYKSTRSTEPANRSSAEVIKEGLAADGGLFVPESIPTLTLPEIEALCRKSYPERAADILSRFLTDYTPEELLEDCRIAYRREIFPGGAAPLVGVRSVFPLEILELWHGPTAAFKDMALQIMPRLLSRALVKTGETHHALILVATSGDTGKAALEGYRNVDRVKIMVFYPVDGVRRVQKLQMATQTGDNLRVVAIKGNFDDAQTGVKNIFADREMAERLNEHGYILSSATSINWGRLVPQIVYYISAYCDLLNKGVIRNGEQIDVCVPTGNFGNIFAAYLAKRMGLPIRRLVCASNQNNVLTDFLATGTYDRNRPFHTTISPSMDILISSNLERMLYYMCGKDSEKVKGWMDDLAKYGRYQVDEQTLSKIREIFVSGHCDNADTFEEIYRVYDACGYVMDPHTAVGSYVLRQLQLKEKCVLLSTASPYKFTRDVLKALKEQPSDDDFVCMEQLSDYAKTVIPQGLYSLKDKEERFSDVISCEKMDAYVEEKTKELLV